MKVLVTGGSGFVGRSTVAALRNRGHTVLAPDRSELNLGEKAAVSACMARIKPSGLVHLAWATEHGDYWTSPANLVWVARSLHLAEEFRRCGGRRIFVAGTSAEYDWSLAMDHEETEALRPQRLYGAAKDALRRILEAWADEYGVSLVWGRIFCPFGPGENPRRLLPRIIRNLVVSGSAEFDGGQEVRDFLHVEDLGAAIAAAFDAELEGPVNLASGRPVRLDQILEQVASVLGARIRFRDTEAGGLGVPRITADITLLREKAGWHPSTDPGVRIRQTCEWWTERLK